MNGTWWRGLWASAVVLYGLALPALAEDRCPADVALTDEVAAEALGKSVEAIVAVKERRSLTLDDLCRAPKGRVERAFWRVEHPKADQPQQWATLRRREQASNNGKIRPNGLARALEQRRTVVEATLAAGGSRAAGIASNTWTSIGPGNVGGRVRAIAMPPTDTQRLWIGTAGGGVWTSTDRGLHWTPSITFSASLAVSALAMSPTNPTVLYAGTGEGFLNADAIQGAGIYRTTDNGATWQQLPSTNPANNSDWFQVNRIAISQTNANVILAATGGGLYRSTDGGTTWTETFNGNVVDVKIDPGNANRVVIGTPGTAPIRYSTDGGVTWSAPTLLRPATPRCAASGSLPPRAEIAFGRFGVVYASVDYNMGSIYRSADSGLTWTLMSNSCHLGDQGWYGNAIWVDPTNSDRLVVGGLDLYRSQDRGASFTRISNWTQSASVHADHHAIVSAPDYDGVNGLTLYFGNDGGVYKTDDIGAVSEVDGWVNLNNGLAITQFYSVAGHTGPNGRIIGGAQDNGSLAMDTGTTWHAFFGGDGGASAIDRTDGNYVYGEYVNLQIARSTTGGPDTATTRYITAGLTDAGPQPDGSTRANFIAPFALDPSNPNRMLAGGISLWRSDNVKAATPTWATISGGGEMINRIAISETDSNVVWISRNGGVIQKTTNATAASPTFTAVANPTIAATGDAREVLGLFVDRANTNVVYLGTGGYEPQNLWRTTDGGATWTDISKGLPAAPVRAIQVHPFMAGWLYVGTEVGIFTSTDNGATWGATTDGPASVSVEQLIWLDPNTLVAATHGRGMYKALIEAPTLAVTRSGPGAGTVTSNPAGLSCGSTCRFDFPVGRRVTLTATPAAGSSFLGWTGACTGAAATCTVTMTADKAVTAAFAISGKPTLVVSKAGTGAGTVTSSPAGIACGGTCSASFAAGAVVTLTAAPAAGSVFAGWGGACTGTATTCRVTLSASRIVSASFMATRPTLTVARGGQGAGAVKSTPAGITCGATCKALFAVGTNVTLTATPVAGSVFAYWSGSCSGTAATCTVAMSTSRAVSAVFRVAAGQVLQVQKAGTGGGTVQSAPAGILCGPACIGRFVTGSTVTLTAVPVAGARFTGWSGACTGTATTCSVSMTIGRGVTANFARADTPADEPDAGHLTSASTAPPR